MTQAAIAALLGTLALGVATGLLYLQRARRTQVVKLHLYAALAATAIVTAAVATAPASDAPGPAGVLPVAMVAVALAAGYGAMRYVRGSRRAAELVLAFHVVLGVASFFVLLAWARRIADGVPLT